MVRTDIFQPTGKVVPIMELQLTTIFEKIRNLRQRHLSVKYEGFTESAAYAFKNVGKLSVYCALGVSEKSIC